MRLTKLRAAGAALLVAAGLAVGGLTAAGVQPFGSTASAAAGAACTTTDGVQTCVLPTSFHGRYTPNAGEIVTASGPLTNVTIRVLRANVTIRDLQITGAETGVSRPAIIDASGGTNVVVEDVILLGQAGQQAQGVYQNGGSLTVRRTKILGVGADRYFDHSFYLSNDTFLIEDVEAYAPYGAAIQLYSGNAKGTARRVDLRDSRWGIVAWGPGNDILVEDFLIHGSRKIENGRGYGIESASGAIVRLRNGYVWDNEAAGNVAGAPGLNVNGGTFEILGGVVFAAPPVEPPPPPPPDEEPPPPPPAVCDQACVNAYEAEISGLEADLADVTSANARLTGLLAQIEELAASR